MTGIVCTLTGSYERNIPPTQFRESSTALPVGDGVGKSAATRAETTPSICPCHRRWEAMKSAEQKPEENLNRERRWHSCERQATT